MQDLSEATQAYEQAKLGIQERDFLIVAHTRSEAAILAQSAEVTSKLHEADKTIESLYDRLAPPFQLRSNLCKACSPAAKKEFLRKNSSQGTKSRAKWPIVSSKQFFCSAPLKTVLFEKAELHSLEVFMQTLCVLNVQTL